MYRVVYLDGGCELWGVALLQRVEDEVVTHVWHRLSTSCGPTWPKTKEVPSLQQTWKLTTP